MRVVNGSLSLQSIEKVTSVVAGYIAQGIVPREVLGLVNYDAHGAHHMQAPCVLPESALQHEAICNECKTEG